MLVLYVGAFQHSWFLDIISGYSHHTLLFMSLANTVFVENMLACWHAINNALLILK